MKNPKVRDVTELLMIPEPPEDPGPIDRFLEAYRGLAGELEQAERSANRRRQQLLDAMLQEVRKKHNQPHLGYAGRSAREKIAHEQFAVDQDRTKLNAALREAEAQRVRDTQAEYADRDAAIAEWDRLYGASRRLEREAFALACEQLFSGFKDALEAAVVAATTSTATVLQDYKSAAQRADALMPDEAVDPAVEKG